MYLLIRDFRLVIILLLFPMLFVSAENDKNKAKKNKATTTKVKKTKRHKAISSGIAYPTKPIFDKVACDLKLDFDLAINGLKVVFEDNSTGKYTHIEWMFGDGNTAQTSSVQHTYLQAGIYYFTATLYNSETGCIDFVAGNYYVSEESQIRGLSRQDVNGTEVLNLTKE